MPPLSNLRHHAEWLSLIEISGPFLEPSVLARVFPQGLDAHDPAVAARIRQAYGEWQANEELRRPRAGIHRDWIDLVLSTALEWPANLIRADQALPPGLDAPMPEYGETLRPTLALVEPGGVTRLLVTVYPAGQNLDGRIAGSRWTASPAARMADLLRDVNVRAGLVVNGEKWMLIDAPRNEAAAYVTWDAALWLDEPITLRAFRALLGIQRLMGVAEDETLEALLTQSRETDFDVTEALGQQVREAVEVLISAIARADRDSNGELLAGVEMSVLYEAGISVMMRLVFMLFAEEQRPPLFGGTPLYEEFYAVSKLREQLREAADQGGEEVLERNSDAWSRLLATFRLIYGGADHESMRQPAYGGSLFDPDRFPFLEGRPSGSSWETTEAAPIPIDNRTVLHLLDALQELRLKVGSGPTETRRLSFRELDVEQIGHVYEGLLDHTAIKATDTAVGLKGTKNKEPEIPLAELEAWRAAGEANLIAKLNEATGKSAPSLTKELTGPLELTFETKFKQACEHDEALWNRVSPFARLVRLDRADRPVIMLAGSVYVTAGTDRRKQGAHYTPRSLTEPIVKNTLEPLVYEGPAEGWERDAWKLRPTSALLRLSVCDLAMGSGAFLVQSCRYLSERVVESWENAIQGTELSLTVEGAVATGDPSEQLVPSDPDERLAIARRLVADRCLYGVDLNPLAVEMAKLSLWLVTLQKNRPFTFLDHALRCGDSLLGLGDIKQLENWALSGKIVGGQLSWFNKQVRDSLDVATRLRQMITESDAVNVRQVNDKRTLLEKAGLATELLRLGADLLMGCALAAEPKERERKRKEYWFRFSLLMESVRELLTGAFTEMGEQPTKDELMALRAEANKMLGGRRPFHWPLEFPEVFVAPREQGESAGFAAIVGNPPFIEGTRISTLFGMDYAVALKILYPSFRGRANICSAFFLRAFSLQRSLGCFGLLATDSISEGDSREAGLETIYNAGGRIVNAIKRRDWQGQAAVKVSVVHVRKGQWNGAVFLDAKPVTEINASLEDGSPDPIRYELAVNFKRCLNGSKLDGAGFLLEPEDADRVIRMRATNREVLFPFLNGEDLNSHPLQAASRWVINFKEMSFDEAKRYPECLEIVERTVRLQRRTHSEQRAREYWWQFQRPRTELYIALSMRDRALVVAATSQTLAFTFCPTNTVFSHAVNVFLFDSYCYFANLQSCVHEVWARRFASTLKGDLTYTPTKVFSGFPFAGDVRQLEQIGQEYFEHRRQLMSENGMGLTQIYNRFHSQSEDSDGLTKLRRLHSQLDVAVTTAYGWTDFDLGHGFHETRQGARFTISEAARREVLDRLLRLNHARHAEEVAEGLHDKGNKKKPGKRAAAQPALAGFGHEE